jgi:hypothetical protein
MDASELEQNLQSLGDLLQSRGLNYELIVVGGGGLLLLGLMDRPTVDIDVIAQESDGEFRAAYELPSQLLEAVADVADLRGVAATWLNSEPADLFRLGLPEGYQDRLKKIEFGALTLHVVGRFEQICFKLHAWVDRYPGGDKHVSDLRLLRPTPEELIAAAQWSRTHDPSDGFRMGLHAALSKLGVTEVSDV